MAGFFPGWLAVCSTTSALPHPRQTSNPDNRAAERQRIMVTVIGNGGMVRVRGKMGQAELSTPWFDGLENRDDRRQVRLVLIAKDSPIGANSFVPQCLALREVKVGE